MNPAPSRPIRPVLTRLAAATLLLAAGELLRQGGRTDDRIAAALERQAVAPAVAAAEFGEIARAPGLIGRAPILGAALVREIRLRQAEAEYWSGDYAALTLLDAGEEAVVDAEMMFLSANAMFRQLQRAQPDATIVRALDETLRRYALVLQNDPGLADAAYNYEIVARLREAAASGIFTDLQVEEVPNVQGEEGSPPEGTRPAEFNVIVPLQPDERRDQQEAGSGGPPDRKG